MSSRWVRLLIFGISLALLGILLSVTPFGSGLEARFGLDNFFRLRGEIPAPGDSVVIAIDRDSMDTMGSPVQLDRWPRSQHAHLIERLSEMGAEAIVFDILFAEQRDSTDETELAMAMRKANNVAIIYMLGNERVSVNDLKERYMGTVTLEQRMYPLKIFSDAALVTTPFVLPKVPTQVRQYWTFRPQSPPSLPVTALEIYSLQFYKTWKTLWQEVNPDLAATLPDHVDSQENRRRVLTFGTIVRQRLLDEPSLSGQLLDSLQRSKLPAKSRQILSALIGVYAGDHSRILNFYGGPRSVETIPYHRILDDPGSKAEQLDLAGKVIFIGYSERRVQAQRDGFFTVFSNEYGQDLAGVEIAATAFSNLLYGEDIKTLPPLAYWCFILSWGLLTTTLNLMLGTRWSLPLTLLLSLSYSTGAYYLFVSHHLWLPLVVPVFFQAPAAFFLGLAMRYFESSSERHRLEKAFAHYVPSDVVRRYSNEDAALETEGRLVHGICLYSDAAQYTRLAERLSPPALAQLVNDYYATVFSPVRNEGGIISDVVGDAMLALWVDQQPESNPASRACTAALAIARATTRTSDNGPTHALPTRIGLHAGPIQLGNVGAGNHYEYRAVGDTVNTATRIEGLNKLLGTQLLVTDNIVAAVPEMLFRPVGRFLLAGKSQVLGIHELLSPDLNASICHSDYLNRYHEGVTAFEMGDWTGALNIFSELQREHPEDGPSLYYRVQSELFLRQPPVNWDGVIRIESK